MATGTIGVLNQKTITKYLPGTSSVLGARDTKMESMFPILQELKLEEKLRITTLCEQSFYGAEIKGLGKEAETEERADLVFQWRLLKN